MPKSWIGSRYTGYSCTSSRLRNVASEVTGPGVTTWRLVRIRPRSASTTKPVACAEEFHSVSKARVWSISMATTLSATRASVPRHAALSPSLCGSCAWVVADCAATWRCADCNCASWPKTGTANRPRISNRDKRMQEPSVVSCSAPQDENPDHGQQQQRHENRRRPYVLGKARE